MTIKWTRAIRSDGGELVTAWCDDEAKTATPKGQIQKKPKRVSGRLLQNVGSKPEKTPWILFKTKKVSVAKKVLEGLILEQNHDGQAPVVCPKCQDKLPEGSQDRLCPTCKHTWTDPMLLDGGES